MRFAPRCLHISVAGSGFGRAPASSLSRYAARAAAGQQFWALLDQGCVSAGNFLTTILLARTLAPAQYGIYVLLYGLILTANNVHSALIWYGMSLQAAVCGKAEFADLVGGALVVTTGLGLLLGAALIAIAAMMCGPLAALLILFAMLFGQFQETTRRALMARMRYRDAILGDALSYLGQAASIAYLVVRRGAGLGAVFAAFALSSGAAALVQALQLRLALSNLKRRPRLISRLWKVGRWALLANLVHNGGAQALLWFLALFGTDQVASFQAAMNVFNTTNPVAYSVGNVVLPTVASSHGSEALAKTMPHAFRGAVFVVLFMAAVMLTPRLVLRCFYGVDSAYLALERELRFLMIASPIAYLAYVLGAYCYGMGRGDMVLWGNCGAAAAILMPGFYLCARRGALGAIGTYDLAVAARIAILALCVRATFPSRPASLQAGAPD